MKNQGLIGWVVAAVLGAALVSVLIYNAASGDDGRSAAIGSTSGPGLGPPPEVAEDTSRIQDAKNAAGKDKLPPIERGTSAPRVADNPPRDCDPNLEPNAFPEWRNNPQTLAEAGAMANQTIVGTVTGVSQGPALRASAPTEPGGAVETPVQNVSIRVDQAIKGVARVGITLTFQRLGDAQGCLRVAGDPPYQQGQRVMLLLENGAEGRPPHVISPAGRYGIGRSGALQPLAENPFAAEVAGQPLEQVTPKLRSG
ncbi:MAG: hypothetical protein ABR521_03965 [Gaiellaceae bacterium]